MSLLYTTTDIRVHHRTLYFYGDNHNFSIPLDDINLFWEEGMVILSWLKKKSLWKHHAIVDGDISLAQFTGNTVLYDSWYTPLTTFAAFGFFPVLS